jgi:hypothetical protein
MDRVGKKTRIKRIEIKNVPWSMTLERFYFLILLNVFAREFE